MVQHQNVKVIGNETETNSTLKNELNTLKYKHYYLFQFFQETASPAVLKCLRRITEAENK